MLNNVATYVLVYTKTPVTTVLTKYPFNCIGLVSDENNTFMLNNIMK